MTVEEMRQLKQQCEYLIDQALNGFTESTGLEVKSINYSRVDVTTHGDADKRWRYMTEVQVLL